MIDKAVISVVKQFNVYGVPQDHNSGILLSSLVISESAMPCASIKVGSGNLLMRAGLKLTSIMPGIKSECFCGGARGCMCGIYSYYINNNVLWIFGVLMAFE